jgi:hypothetical protein
VIVGESRAVRTHKRVRQRGAARRGRGLATRAMERRAARRRVARALVGALWLSLCAAEDAPRLWRAAGEERRRALEGRALRHRALEGVEGRVFVEVDWPALVSAAEEATLAGGARVRSVGGPAAAAPALSLELPGGTVLSCSMFASQLAEPLLFSRVPELKALSGRCRDGSQLEVSLVLSSSDSMSAVVHAADQRTYYVDSAFHGSRTYVVYDAQARGGEAPPFQCSAGEGVGGGPSHEKESGALLAGQQQHQEERQHHHRRLRGGARRLASGGAGSITGRQFRLAVSTSGEFSAMFGNNVATTLSTLLTALARVNGVLTRELGVFMQMIGENDKLICVPGNCAFRVSNSNDALAQNWQFMQAQGVGASAFDVGHVLVTGSGGVAAYPAVCASNPEGRARGCTGTMNPLWDSFQVDYWAHELGHQLYGAHTFRDCGQYIMLDGAVEEGSGTTIMSYAGSCGATNVQGRADPYFNSFNVVAMRAYVAKVASKGCGTEIQTGRVQPAAATSFDVCAVPVGNYVRLDGYVEGSDGVGLFYSWDRIDTGAESFLDPAKARFRPWRPTARTSRTLPHMYFISQGKEQMAERLPQSKQDMLFRFAVRSLFVPDAKTSALSADAVGGFSYKDVKVSFLGEDASAALRITSAQTDLTPGQPLTVTWTGGAALTPTVRLVLAINPMWLPKSQFDYAKDVQELDWIELGRYATAARSATVTVPQLLINQQARVALMLRSDGGDCYFFDIQPLLLLKASNMSLTALPAPTARPRSPPTGPTAPTAPTTLTPTRSGKPEGAAAAPARAAGAGSAHGVAVVGVATAMVSLGFALALVVRRRMQTTSSLTPKHRGRARIGNNDDSSDGAGASTSRLGARPALKASFLRWGAREDPAAKAAEGELVRAKAATAKAEPERPSSSFSSAWAASSSSARTLAQDEQVQPASPQQWMDSFMPSLRDSWSAASSNSARSSARGTPLAAPSPPPVPSAKPAKPTPMSSFTGLKDVSRMAQKPEVAPSPASTLLRKTTSSASAPQQPQQPGPDTWRAHLRPAASAQQPLRKTGSSLAGSAATAAAVDRQSSSSPWGRTTTGSSSATGSPATIAGAASGQQRKDQGEHQPPVVAPGKVAALVQTFQQSPKQQEPRRPR